MKQEEKYIARIQFKNKVLSLSGQAFEDFVVRIMQVFDKDFRPIKPHSKEGDKKNDGYIKSKGIYYQIYAPEEPKRKEKESIDKLQDTIPELKNYWTDISEIKEFYWVYNDKYQGIFPSIEKELATIEKENSFGANPFLCKNLEDVFLSLPDDDIRDILGGFLPDYTEITAIDINVLGEVINYLIKYDFNHKDISFPEKPDFEKKIKFNNLSNPYGYLLKNASYLDYMISEYFSLNSKYALEDLKFVFMNFYQEALAQISDNIIEKPDLVFDYILQKSSPRDNKAVKDSVLILMAHYFESCDIYEEPVKPKQEGLF